MPRSQKALVLTAKDREELTPLLNTTKAERDLMPKDMLQKLEILAKEQESKDGFQDIEQIIKESLNIVESLRPHTLRRRHIKDLLWWQVNYHIFLAQRKAQRARRKCYKKNAS